MPGKDCSALAGNLSAWFSRTEFGQPEGFPKPLTHKEYSCTQNDVNDIEACGLGTWDEANAIGYRYVRLAPCRGKSAPERHCIG